MMLTHRLTIAFAALLNLQPMSELLTACQSWRLTLKGTEGAHSWRQFNGSCEVLKSILGSAFGQVHIA